MNSQRSFQSITSIVLGILFLAITSGCSNKPQRIAANGTVSFDNAKVESGQIFFLPKDESLPQSNAKIVGGRYQIAELNGLFLGSYSVKVLGYEETGNVTDLGPLYDHRKQKERRQFLPEKYNRRSELSVDIVEGETTYDFELVSESE